VIFVKRDQALIPEKVLKDAESAQLTLNALPADERAAYIKKKSNIWSAFSKYLSAMSYGKCWYSESPEVHSFFDVDHYRPKLETRRSDTETDDGYEWLAFSWDNFRLSAQRSNRLSTNEDTDETEGKSSWFPLLEGSPKACWDNRCVNDERPVLLDPTKKEDVRLITVKADGSMGPSRFCVGTRNIIRVSTSIILYGLDLPRLKGARMRVMRDIKNQADDLLKFLEEAEKADAVANALPVDGKIEALQEKTHPREPYASAARSQLHMMGLGELCIHPEETGA